MELHRSVELLLSYQQPIKLVLVEAKRQLRLEEGSSMKALALVRWELMRHLRAYQIYKHSQIFDPVIRGKVTSKAAVAATLKLRCIEVASAFEEHVRRWALHGPMAAWDVYVNEATTMASQIERHMISEAEQVQALLSSAKEAGKDHPTVRVSSRLHSQTA